MTHLGPRGYTLWKSELTPQQQKQIKDQLTVKPIIIGAPVQSQKSFPVYRESLTRLYVPRYFGYRMFGKPETVAVPEGDDINLEFQGTLRDYQVTVSNAYLNQVSGGGGGLIEMYCGAGKTDTTLSIISQLKKKTLIVVHKEFLMNQWIERIQRYYPMARVGKIQGQVIDIDNKDIVIAMLQSLSMKDYPLTLFSSFGFTIIDEVHHISSEVFSCALFKIVTKYMLGLSATMERKDGTTKVFKMFLGEVAYKLERSKEDHVVVRGIKFQTKDAEFNEIETDFRGNVAVAKMLSKICAYSYRSEFILRVLQDMLVENPKQQIMMLAAYKNILKYMHDAIKHRNICSVGYYVGGMKESALKESEGKQVVLATYSMAAEGLDIKTLSTLFMITPMTNIEQSVGRILRQKHSFAPIVVDFVDAHDNFVRQWNKRRQFYKKQNYTILYVNSQEYTSNASSWKCVHKGAVETVNELEEIVEEEEDTTQNERKYEAESQEEADAIEESKRRRKEEDEFTCGEYESEIDDEDEEQTNYKPTCFILMNK